MPLDNLKELRRVLHNSWASARGHAARRKLERPSGPISDDTPKRETWSLYIPQINLLGNKECNDGVAWLWFAKITCASKIDVAPRHRRYSFASSRVLAFLAAEALASRGSSSDGLPRLGKQGVVAM